MATNMQVYREEMMIRDSIPLYYTTTVELGYSSQ